MRIIVLDEEFPYPLNTGKRIRSFNLLSRLAKNNELHYLAYGRDSDSNFIALARNNMNPIAVKNQVPKKSGLLFYLRLFNNLFSSESYIVDSHYSDLYQNRLDELIEKLKPGIVMAEWTPYASFMKNLKNCKRLIVAHNIESTIWQRYYEHETNSIKKLYIFKQWKKLEKFEKDVFRNSDGITAVSQEEADEIRKISDNKNVALIDNGVDLKYFNAHESHSGGSNSTKLVFTGSMDWRPNQDAAVYFVREIFPKLKALIPEISATFVGRNPTDEILSLQDVNGITITGTVDDVRPYIEEASIYIVPIRIGGGSRLKILEALAMKKAVVSTSVGAEGLKTKDKKHLLVADSAVEFVAEIERLLKNPQLAKELGDNGRELVEQSYGWDALALKLDNFLQQVVNNK